MVVQDQDDSYVVDDTQWPLVAVTHVKGHRWLFMFSDHFGPDAPQIESAPVFAEGTEPDPSLTLQAARQASARAMRRTPT